LTSQAISLVKDSALVSTIAVYDLTMRGQEVISETTKKKWSLLDIALILLLLAAGTWLVYRIKVGIETFEKRPLLPNFGVRLNF